MEPKFEYPDKETAARLLKAYPGYHQGWVKSQPGDLMLPANYANHWKTYSTFKLRSDDVFVLSHPKSGTTWTQEMVWLIANDCDFIGAKQTLTERFPFLEYRLLVTDESLEGFVELGNTDTNEVIIPPNYINQYPSPRFIKSHLPLINLPSNLLDESKVVYVARNPKDVTISYFHHLKNLDPVMNMALDIHEFIEYFMNNEVLYSPYWVNVIDAWNKRHNPNLLFLFYEDMKMDLPSQIKKVATFLGKKPTGDQIKALVKHLGFDKFKTNPSVNYTDLQALGFFKNDGQFVRKGQIGDWKNYFTVDQSMRFDKWIEANLKNTDLRFPTFG